MPVDRKYVVEHLTPPPGITMPPYPAARDRVYRWALVALTAGLAAEGIGIVAHSPMAVMIAGAGSMAAGVLAAWTFLVWLAGWRWFVRGLATAGALVFLWVPVLGWAGVLAAAAIMAAKEEHCFHFWPGRVIPWATVVLGISRLFAPMGLVTGLLFLLLAGLWAALLLGRFRLPLFAVD